MSGIDRTSSVKQTRATKDGSSAQNPPKNAKSTPVKVTVASGYRLRSTPEISSPAVRETRRHVLPDSSKSQQSPVKKRAALKINKSLKVKSSPYATRSLSPLISFLRSGKRKREAESMIPKFKKRVVGDREDTKLVVEGSKKEIESDQSTPKSQLGQSRKRNVPTSKSCTQFSKKCKISPSPESENVVNSAKHNVDVESVELKEDSQDQASNFLESLAVEPSVKEECEKGSSPQNSGDIFDIPLDKSSSCNTLGEFSESHFETGEVCSTDDLIVKNDSNNSCDIMFDLSKCDNCLQPVIVDTKENLNSDMKADGSDATLPEMLYLSDSRSSFDGVSETYNHENEMPKTDLEVDPCTLDDCSDILSIENSAPSLMVCNSSPRNAHRGVTLPPYGSEDESVSVNAACESLSMLDAEESMNEFMHEISSTKGRENTLDFADSSNDSNQIDATSIIKTLEQTEPLSDDLDTLSKDQDLGTYGVSSKGGRSDALGTVENVTVESIVGVMGSSMHHHDLNDNLKETNVHLSVYDGAHVVGLGNHHENYSIDAGAHLQGLSASIDNCGRLATLDIQGNNNMLNADHTASGIPDTYSMLVKESASAPKAEAVTEASESEAVIQEMNDDLPDRVSQPFMPLEVHDLSCVSADHTEQDVGEIPAEHRDESRQPAEGMNVEAAVTVTQESGGCDDSERLSVVDEHSVKSFNSKQEPQGISQKSPCTQQVVNTSEEQSGSISVSDDNMSNAFETAPELVDEVTECDNAPVIHMNVNSSEGERTSKTHTVPKQDDTDEQLEKSLVDLSEADHPILPAYNDSSIGNSGHENSISIPPKSSENVDSSAQDGSSVSSISLDLGAVHASAEDTSLVGTSPVVTCDIDINVVDTNSVDASNVDINDVDADNVDTNSMSINADKEPVVTSKPSIEEIESSNEELSEPAKFNEGISKDKSVDSFDDADMAIYTEGESKFKDNGDHKGVKDDDSGESVDTCANSNPEMSEGANSGKKNGGENTKDCTIGQIPCVHEESSGVSSQDATSSESEKIEQSISKPVTIVEEDSAEQLAIKETILNALGLQSSRAASMAKNTVRQELPPIPSRTSGTLKTIIKVPKMADKKRARNPLRLSLDIHRSSQDKDKDCLNARRSANEQGEISCPLSADQHAPQDPLAFRIFNESCISPSDSWDAHISKHKSKSHGNSRKFPSGDHIPHLDPKYLPFSKASINGLSGSSSLDWQSKTCQDLDHNVPSDGSSNSGRSSQQGSSEGSGEASLVIPEKSASFSIHPERLCHDVCCYCFGKFGSLDTPMHLAQMKREEKRRTALALEANLQQDSCLCDACYRYLDRKASCPSYQPYRRQAGVSGGILTKPQVCCVRGCSLPAHHLVRRKWLTRLRRTISKLLPIELTPVPSHQQQPLHAPLCSRHFYCLEYYSLCGICKRKLSRNNMHPVGREVHDLNSILMEDAIPVTLTGKIFLCKMCRYYSGIRLKYRDKSLLSSGHRTFFNGYRKRIWHYLGIQTLDSSEISEPMEIPKKKKKSRFSEGESSKSCEMERLSRNEDGTPSQSEEIIGSESVGESTSGKVSGHMPTKIRLKLGNVSIGQLDNVDLSSKETLPSGSHRGKSDSSKPKKKSSGSSEPKNACFPGIEHLGLNASFVFHGNNVGEKNKEWEKCTTTVQFDSKTKKLWQNLYYPYGNFSSFLRHLVIMEKNWRNGDLILAPNASPQAVNYVKSVQNRIAAYEGNSPSDCVRSSLPSTSSCGRPVSSRPVSASTSLLSKSPHSSMPSVLSTPVSSSVTPTTPLVPQDPLPLLRLPPMVISTKSTCAVPPKMAKEAHILPSPPAAPRISLSSSQISQRVQTVTAPITAQLIPVSAATNFLPMACGPSQFLSFGNANSFIQLGGNSGLVHQVGGPYPCVQFNQRSMTDKVMVDKGEASGSRGNSSCKNPSSSLAGLELHISNVRSLADDAGSNNTWEQQSDTRVLPDENACSSDSATQSSGRSEEHLLEVNSVGSVASLAIGSMTLETDDNHLDEAVGNPAQMEQMESQGNVFEIV